MREALVRLLSREHGDPDDVVAGALVESAKHNRSGADSRPLHAQSKAKCARYPSQAHSAAQPGDESARVLQPGEVISHQSRPGWDADLRSAEYDGPDSSWKLMRKGVSVFPLKRSLSDGPSFGTMAWKPVSTVPRSTQGDRDAPARSDDRLDCDNNSSRQALATLVKGAASDMTQPRAQGQLASVQALSSDEPRGRLAPDVNVVPAARRILPMQDQLPKSAAGFEDLLRHLQHRQPSISNNTSISSFPETPVSRLPQSVNAASARDKTTAWSMNERDCHQKTQPQRLRGGAAVSPIPSSIDRTLDAPGEGDWRYSRSAGEENGPLCCVIL